MAPPAPPTAAPRPPIRTIGCPANRHAGSAPSGIPAGADPASPPPARPSSREDRRRLMMDEAPAAVLLHEEVGGRSEEHTSELQSLMRISYAVFCLTTKKNDI